METTEDLIGMKICNFYDIVTSLYLSVIVIQIIDFILID